MRAGGLDQSRGPFVLMRSEVVHDDDVAWTQSGTEDGTNVGVEDLGVGRSVDRHASRAAIQPHRGNHGRRLPVPMRTAGEQTLATGRTAPQPGHIGLGRRLVDEDEPRRIQPALPADPPAPSPDDVGPALLSGTERLFLYVRSIDSSA